MQDQKPTLIQCSIGTIIKALHKNGINFPNNNNYRQALTDLIESIKSESEGNDQIIFPSVKDEPAKATTNKELPGKSVALTSELLSTFTSLDQTEILTLENFLASKNIHQIRELLGTFIENKTLAPEIQIEWDFRVNRDQERNGDHVMDFTFKPNDEREMVFVSKERKYSRWVFGDKIEIGFEWAQGDKKAYAQPTSDSAQRQLTVTGKRAVFSYSNSWSLFSLLQMHRTRGNILKFEIPQDNGDKFIGYNKIRFLKPGLTPKDPKQYIELDDIQTGMPPELLEEIRSVIQGHEEKAEKEN
jgi:hypothetical protein